MSNHYLVLDCPYLCWRAFHSVGRLDSGVEYGFLRDLLYLQDRCMTDKVLFCWDYGPPLRRDFYRKYKANRLTDRNDPDKKNERIQVHLAMRGLSDEILPEIGFRNVFQQWGYEADDLIASIVKHAGDDQITIVSADKDLYQLISDTVSIWNPHHPSKRMLLDREVFIREYGIEPRDWVTVKAIAGCSSDEIEGIRGVGVKTAIKYIRNELKEGSKQYKNIKDGEKIIARNLSLVLLPYPGTIKFKIRDDEVTISKWKHVNRRLGFKSLKL